MDGQTPLEHSLRLALFSGNYNYVVDGPARALNRLVAFLERRDIAVMVFAPTAKQPAMPHQGTLIPVPSISFPLRPDYRLALGLTPGVKARLKAFRPSLFHLAAPDLLGRAALRQAQRWNLPAVASFHTRFDTYGRYYGIAALEKYMTRYLHNFYSRCDQVYAPSPSMLDELRRENLGTDLRLWSRGVDAQQFNPGRRDLAWRRHIGFADKDVVINFTGRLVLEKGLDFFADMIALLEQQGKAHKVLIVGDGPARAHLQSRLPKAYFAGYLSDGALATAYASSDIFFNPSISETFGNTTLEAMASGVPCVCAAAVGSNSLVKHGKTGYLVPPGDHQAFAKDLCALAESPDLRARFGTHAVAAASHFEWNVILGALVDNYLEALARRQGLMAA